LKCSYIINSVDYFTLNTWYAKSSYLMIFIIVLIQQNIHNTCIKHDLWMLYFKAFKWCLQEARRRFDKASQLYDQVLWKLHNIVISASIFYFISWKKHKLVFWVFSMILYSFLHYFILQGADFSMTITFRNSVFTQLLYWQEFDICFSWTTCLIWFMF